MLGIKSINAVLQNYLDSGFTPSEIDGKDLRTIRFINLVVGLTTLLLTSSSILELLVLHDIQDLIVKSTILLICLRFIFWHRRRNHAKTIAVILTGFGTMFLLLAVLTDSLNSNLALLVFIIPLINFFIASLPIGITWSVITTIWITLVGTLHYFDLYPGNLDFSWFLSLLFGFIFISILSYSYAKLINDSEQNFQAKNSELERLIYIISHDLRTPLTSIKGFVSFLEEDVKNNDHENLIHDFKRLEQVSNNMETMINDLLNLSRMGRDQEGLSEVNTMEMINTILIDSESLFKIQNIQVETAGAFPTITTSKRKLEEVIRNLISNSIKYIGKENPSPKIIIGVNENAFEYVFYVKDNGIGINPDAQARLFTLFYQVNQNNTEGTGIGLSVVKGFIEDMGGKVWVESQQGQGSTFWFSIPKNRK